MWLKYCKYMQLFLLFNSKWIIPAPPPPKKNLTEQLRTFFLLLLPLHASCFFFLCVIACTVTGECSCTRCTDRRVLPLVLSEDKFVYMRWGDIPPNEIALVHHTVLSVHDTQSTQWLSATLQAMHKHTARILSMRVHAHTNTHIMKA